MDSAYEEGVESEAGEVDPVIEPELEDWNIRIIQPNIRSNNALLVSSLKPDLTLSYPTGQWHDPRS